MTDCLPITSIYGLQAACCAHVATATPNERKAVDQLCQHAVAYCGKYRVRTDRDRARAERRVRKRAKTGLIFGGVIESIALSLLAQFAIAVFRWFWNWAAQTPDSERLVNAMAAGLPAWADDPSQDNDD